MSFGAHFHEPPRHGDRSIIDTPTTSHGHVYMPLSSRSSIYSHQEDPDASSHPCPPPVPPLPCDTRAAQGSLNLPVSIEEPPHPRCRRGSTPGLRFPPMPLSSPLESHFGGPHAPSTWYTLEFPLRSSGPPHSEEVPLAFPTQSANFTRSKGLNQHDQHVYQTIINRRGLLNNSFPTHDYGMWQDHVKECFHATPQLPMPHLVDTAYSVTRHPPCRNSYPFNPHRPPAPFLNYNPVPLDGYDFDSEYAPFYMSEHEYPPPPPDHMWHSSSSRREVRNGSIGSYGQSRHYEDLCWIRQAQNPRRIPIPTSMPQPRQNSQALPLLNPQDIDVRVPFHSHPNLENRGYWMSFLFNKCALADLLSADNVNKLKDFLEVWNFRFSLTDEFLNQSGDRWCILSHHDKTTLIAGVVFFVHFCRRKFIKKRKGVIGKKGIEPKPKMVTSYTKSTFKFIYDCRVDYDGSLKTKLGKMSANLDALRPDNDRPMDDDSTTRSYIVSQSVGSYDEMIHHVFDYIKGLPSELDSTIVAEDPYVRLWLGNVESRPQFDHQLLGVVSAVRAKPTAAISTIVHLCSIIIDANKESGICPVGAPLKTFCKEATCCPTTSDCSSYVDGDVNSPLPAPSL